MKRRSLVICTSIAIYLLIAGSLLQAQRQLEYLDRGLVAILNTEGKVFISWRLLPTDPTFG